MEVNHTNTLIHATVDIDSPTNSDRVYSVVKANETQVTGNTQLDRNKRQSNKQDMYSMIKKPFGP